MQETWSVEPWSIRVARYQLHGGLIPLAYQMISDPNVKTREVLAMWMAHRPGIVYLYTKGVKEEIIAKSPDSVLCVDEAFIAKLIQAKIISKINQTDANIDLIGSQHKRDGFVLYQAILKDTSAPSVATGSNASGSTNAQGTTSGANNASGAGGGNNNAHPSSSASNPGTGPHGNQSNTSNPHLAGQAAHMPSSMMALGNTPSSLSTVNASSATGPNASSATLAESTEAGGAASQGSTSTPSQSSLLFHLRVPYSNSASLLQLLHSGITTFPISTREAAKMTREMNHHSTSSSAGASGFPGGNDANGVRERGNGTKGSSAEAASSLLFPSSLPSSLYSTFAKPPHPSFVFTNPASTLPTTIPNVTPFADPSSRLASHHQQQQLQQQQYQQQLQQQQQMAAMSNASTAANASNNHSSSAGSSMPLSAQMTNEAKQSGVSGPSDGMGGAQSSIASSNASVASAGQSSLRSDSKMVVDDDPKKQQGMGGAGGLGGGIGVGGQSTSLNTPNSTGLSSSMVKGAVTPSGITPSLTATTPGVNTPSAPISLVGASPLPATGLSPAGGQHKGLNNKTNIHSTASPLPPTSASSGAAPTAASHADFSSYESVSSMATASATAAVSSAPLPTLSSASLAPLIELPFLPPSDDDMKMILDHLPMYLAHAKPIQFLPHSQKLLEFPTPATPTLANSPHPHLTTETQILRRRDRKLDDELDRYTVIYYLQLIFPPKTSQRF